MSAPASTSTLELQLTKTFRNRKVFVTGHTGFKGSWLCEWLLGLGAEVHGFALDPQPHELLFGQLDLPARLHGDTRGDLRDRELLAQTLTACQPDVVFHLAAQPLVRLSYAQPVETWQTNVMGTINVLEALRTLAAGGSLSLSSQSLNKSGDPATSTQATSTQATSTQTTSTQTTSTQTTSTSTFNNPVPRRVAAVMITTDKVYENREWNHGYREEDPLGGYDPYSSSKGAAEIAIASWRRSFFGPEHPVKIASARAGNVIGGGDWAQDRIVPDAIKALQANQPIPVRNKISTRPWQHVLEPLSGYLLLASKMTEINSLGLSNQSLSKAGEYGTSTQTASTSTDSEAVCSAFNFGPNLTSNHTVADLVQEILLHWPGHWDDRSDPNAPHEAGKLNLATDKAFHLLGWQPRWDFPTTIEKTVDWYRAVHEGHNPAELTRRQIQEYMLKS